MLPTTAKELKAISDVGKVRWEKKDKILEVIKDYCEENKIRPKEAAKINPQKSRTQQISFKLFLVGKSTAENVKERSLTSGTIEGHLSTFLALGKIKIIELMSEEKYTELKNIMESVPQEGFSDLKVEVDDKYTYSELRMVLTALQFEK